MPDLLANGSDWLQEQRHLHLSRPVAYWRGPRSIAMQATVGQTDFELTDDSGIFQRIDSRDFLIRTQDMAFGLPQAGDRIVDAGTDYEVMSPGGGRPPWRYSDNRKLTMRVHTKAVGEAVP